MIRISRGRNFLLQTTMRDLWMLQFTGVEFISEEPREKMCKDMSERRSKHLSERMKKKDPVGWFGFVVFGGGLLCCSVCFCFSAGPIFLHSKIYPDLKHRLERLPLS